MPLSLATFNVKDLFGLPGASERPEHQTLSRAELDAKLDSLASSLHRVDADVVALQEVGSLRALDALAERLGSYAERVVGTPDGRGIRNAVLSRLPIVASSVRAPASLAFPVFRRGDPPPFGERIPMRRAIVHVAVEPVGMGRVDVVTLHFKSNRRLPIRSAEGELDPFSDASSPRELAEGELRSLVWRAAEALFVRGVVDDLKMQAPAAQVAVMGDFNDRPGSLVLGTVAGTGEGELFSCADVIAAERRFSILHRRRGELLDHILVTANLRSRLLEARLLNEDLRDHGALPIPEGEAMPRATPDSDHACLVARFG